MCVYISGRFIIDKKCASERAGLHPAARGVNCSESLLDDRKASGHAPRIEICFNQKGIYYIKNEVSYNNL